MERRNFIKNIAALALISQIDIAEANELDQSILMDYIKLTLQSNADKIKLNCHDLTLSINWEKNSDIVEIPVNIEEMNAVEYRRDLFFTAKLTEGQQWFIRDALSSRDETQFTFKVDDLIYEGNGLIMECGFADTQECDVTLRINTANVIYNEIYTQIQS